MQIRSDTNTKYNTVCQSHKTSMQCANSWKISNIHLLAAFIWRLVMNYKQHFVGRELMCYWIIPNTSKREFSTRDFIIFINKCHTIRILLVHVTFNRKTLRFLSTTINDFYKDFSYIIFLMLQYTNNHTYVRHYYSLTKKLKWQIICCA